MSSQRREWPASEIQKRLHIYAKQADEEGMHVRQSVLNAAGRLIAEAPAMLDAIQAVKDYVSHQPLDLKTLREIQSELLAIVNPPLSRIGGES